MTEITAQNPSQTAYKRPYGALARDAFKTYLITHSHCPHGAPALALGGAAALGVPYASHALKPFNAVHEAITGVVASPLEMMGLSDAHSHRVSHATVDGLTALLAATMIYRSVKRRLSKEHSCDGTQHKH